MSSWAFFPSNILRVPLTPSWSAPSEDVNELNTVLPNILRNTWYTSKSSNNDFGIIYDLDFDTFGFSSLLSLLS